MHSHICCAPRAEVLTAATAAKAMEEPSHPHVGKTEAMAMVQVAAEVGWVASASTQSAAAKRPPRRSPAL